MSAPPEDDCFAIRQASRFVSQIYDHHLAGVGLTITQYSILVRLRRHGRLRIQQIAAGMVMDRTSVVRAVQPLQRDGLIERRSGSHRARTIGITAAGNARLDVAYAHWAAAQRAFEQQFGMARAHTLRRELLDLSHPDRGGTPDDSARIA